jgi:biopolymer transport protein ExbD
MKFKRRLTTTSTPDLVPMIDVVFQLVVFFLMSSTFVVSPGIALQLPGSSTTEPVVTSDAEALNLYLYASGELFVGDVQFGFDELDLFLKNQGFSPTTRITIFAENTVEYQLVIQLLDIVRSNGFLQVALRANVLE